MPCWVCGLCRYPCGSKHPHLMRITWESTDYLNTVVVGFCFVLFCLFYLADFLFACFIPSGQIYPCLMLQILRWTCALSSFLAFWYLHFFNPRNFREQNVPSPISCFTSTPSYWQEHPFKQREDHQGVIYMCLSLKKKAPHWRSRLGLCYHIGSNQSQGNEITWRKDCLEKS